MPQFHRTAQHEFYAFFMFVIIMPNIGNSGRQKNKMMIHIQGNSNFCNRHIDITKNSFFLLFFMVLSLGSYSQEVIDNGTYSGGQKEQISTKEHISFSFRKHFVLVVDQTIRKDSYQTEYTERLFRLLSDIFTGKNPNSKNDVMVSGFNQLDDQLYFDSTRDQLTLYACAVTGSGRSIDNYKSNGYNDIRNLKDKKLTEEELPIKVFSKLIHKRTSFSGSGKSLTDFLNKDMKDLFYGVDPLNQYEGYKTSLPSVVYPAILDFLKTDTSAEEYVILLVSDFVSGDNSSINGDMKNIIDLVGDNKTKQIYNYLDNRKSLFTFDFEEFKISFLKRDAKIPRIIGGRLRPRALENVSVGKSSGDVCLTQKSYNSDNFQLSETSILFAKNRFIDVDAIQIIVRDINNNVYSDIMLQSSPTELYDEKNQKFNIPSVDVSLPNAEEGNDYIVDYKFFTIVKDANGKSIIPYVFSSSVQTSLSQENFVTLTESKMVYYYLLGILGVLAIIILTIMRGKKKIAEIKASDFLDEYIDVTPKRGAVRQSCLFVKKGQKPAPIPVRVRIRGKHKFLAFPWNEVIYVYVDDSELPETTLYNDENGVKKEAIRYVINNDYDNSRKWVPLEKDAKTSFWGLGKSKDEIAKCVVGRERFSHYLIEDLGNTWIGIDPGTTGSCIAISGDTQGAADNPSIEMIEVKRGTETTNIIPSKLVLDKPSIIGKTVSEMVPGQDYDYGVNADQTWKLHINKGHNCYQSIKKLLGYKKTSEDKIIAKFGEGKECSFTGVELAHLLIKGLKKSLDDYIDSLPPQKRQVLIPDGNEARRAVVAIPNNYTLSKTLDMVNSIKMLKSFQEVRFIYEAEGVLFNYLRKTYGKKKTGQENIMVFDMGGATINVSIFKVEYYVEDHTVRFKVRTLARIGYAIGGDNIDVALLETLLTMPELNDSAIKNETKRHEYEARNKTRFLDDEHVFGLKKELSGGVGRDFNILANHGNFVNFVNKFLETEKQVSEEAFESLADKFSKVIWNRLTTDSIYMQKFIYDNISDAIKEIINFKEVTALDRIIFSGRSTMFPKVRSTVQNALSNKYKEIDKKIWNGLTNEEIKTCVANGACWYGRYGLVTLDNSLINCSYGFKCTEEDGKHLYILLKPEQCFEGEKPLYGSKDIESAFKGDGGNVCFYQVMGSGNVEKIFDDANRHKVNFLGAVHLKNKTSQISITVDRRNKVEGTIQYESGHEETLNVEAEDHDMVNENEWPYIFHTLTEDLGTKPSNENVSTPSSTTTVRRARR